MQISQYIYHNAALPVASHSAEVPWRSLCSASNTHNNLTELIAAEWRPTTGLFSEQGTFFFSCEGKHYNVLDTDLHSFEGHSPGRFECVLMGLHRSGPLPAETGDTAWDYPGNLNCLSVVRQGSQGVLASKPGLCLLVGALEESYDRKSGYLRGRLVTSQRHWPEAP